MKLFLDRTLVVEGKEDASYLSNYIESEIVVVNGYEIAASTLSYLKTKPVILLLDPDEAGKTIRKKLKEEIEDAIDVEIDINKCIRGKKTGVAECQIEEILEKLRPFDRNKVDKNTDITLSKLIDLGLSDNELRKEVCEKLNLGRCNCKLLLKRLTINNVQLEQLNAIIKECKNGNK